MAQFWCAELRADKGTPFVPPPEASTRLHISQATLVPDAAPDGQRVAVKCKVDEQEAFLCSLRAGSAESMRLDLIFDGYTEFELVGPKGARVHLVGYLVEDEGGLEGSEDDDELPEDMSEAEMRRALLDQLIASGRIPDDMSDSEDDESEESEDEEGGSKRRSSVIIEDVTEPQVSGRKIAIEGPDSAAKPAAKAKAAAAAAVKAAAAAEAAAAAAEGSEESEEESEESGEDNEEDSSDEEMEAEAEARPAPKAAAAAAKEPKRKAQEKQAPAAAAKKAKTEAAQPAAKAAAKAGAKAEAKAEPAAAQNGTPAGKKAVRRFPNGFAIETLALGPPSGKLAKPGKRVAMKYVGKLEKGGKVFDQTRGSKTFAFRLGVGEVIKGWDQGVVGMRVGDKRRLTVPPQMAYGAEGVKGVIPGNATLVFDVELVDVKG